MQNAISVLIMSVVSFNISIADNFSSNFLSKPTCTNEETGKLLPHESDCTKFYQCVHGIMYEQNCPEGTHFSPELNVCDLPDVVKCDLKPVINCENSEKSFIPHEDNCSMFYLCLSGQKYLLNCKEGWEFDYDKQNCAEVSNTGCTANKS